MKFGFIYQDGEKISQLCISHVDGSVRNGCMSQACINFVYIYVYIYIFQMYNLVKSKHKHTCIYIYRNIFINNVYVPGYIYDENMNLHIYIYIVYTGGC